MNLSDDFKGFKSYILTVCVKVVLGRDTCEKTKVEDRCVRS